MYRFNGGGGRGNQNFEPRNFRGAPRGGFGGGGDRFRRNDYDNRDIGTNRGGRFNSSSRAGSTGGGVPFRGNRDGAPAASTSVAVTTSSAATVTSKSNTTNAAVATSIAAKTTSVTSGTITKTTSSSDTKTSITAVPTTTSNSSPAASASSESLSNNKVITPVKTEMASPVVLSQDNAAKSQSNIVTPLMGGNRGGGDNKFGAAAKVEPPQNIADRGSSAPKIEARPSPQAPERFGSGQRNEPHSKAPDRFGSGQRNESPQQSRDRFGSGQKAESPQQSSSRGSDRFGGGQRNDQHNRTEQQSFKNTDRSTKKEEGNGGAEEKMVIEEMSKHPPQKKFTGRCRLFVGNLTSDTTEEEFVKLFEPFGETCEAFLNAARGFGFIRLDTRHNAENARRALDGRERKNRNLRVRFASHGAALRVKYLSQHVSNEMLEETFSMFGDVERAVIVVDDRGRPSGEGIVEFARKPGALSALKRITDGVFLMGTSLRPIAVEPLEDKDENDGLPEIFFLKSGDLVAEREKPPRFAQQGSVEYEYGQKWKNLYQMYKEREDMLKRNFEEECIKLDQDQETAKLEMHAAMLRQDLMRRQEELRRLEEQASMEAKRRMEIRLMEEERRRKEMDSMESRRRQQHDQQMQMHQGPSQQQHHPQMQQMQQQQQQQPQQQQKMQQDWQQQQQQQQQQQLRGDRGSLQGQMQPPPVPPGIDRSRVQVIGGGGVQQVGGVQMGSAGVPLSVGVVPLELAVAQQQQQQQQPGNLRAMSRFDAPHPGMGANGGGNAVREIGGKAGLGVPAGHEDYFDAKRARRF